NRVKHLRGNSGTGNGQNYIQVRGGNISSSGTWNKQGLDYVITGDITVRHSSYANDGSRLTTLTIEPGVEIRFETGTGLYIGKPHPTYSWVGYWGALSVQGTVNNPVIFTSNAASPGPADWKGIYFHNWTGDSQSRLQHCVIEYGGHTHNANIYLADAKPAIQYNTIRNSSHSGIYVNGTGSSGTTVQCNNFKENHYGVYVVNNATPVIQNNNFLGNQQAGVYNGGTPALDVQNNWWGDISGPNNDSDHTYGNVSAAPWLTAPSDCIASPPANEPPHIPTDPLPLDNAVRVPVSDDHQPVPVSLSWTARDPNPWDAIVYDVYFGTVQGALTLVAEDLESNFIDVSDLAAGTTHYWQVIAKDDAGAQTPGPIWQFTSMGSLPDLVLSDVTQDPPGALEAGMSVNFTARVANNGTGPVVDPFQITFKIDDIPIGTHQIDQVIQGDASFQVSQPWTAQGGDHLFKISIDSLQAVAELNEDNNSFTDNLAVAALSDETGPVIVAEQLNGSSLADGNLLFEDGMFTMNLEDLSEIYWVEYWLGGVRIKKDFNQATFLECQLDITGLDDGNHNLTVEAYDEHFNSTTVSYTIVVNQPPPFDCFKECID
ncbi:hypothetical protein D1AOALGA4SA_11020, partial [Olavius algarvensis Delta 1 endosymbiont]